MDRSRHRYRLWLAILLVVSPLACSQPRDGAAARGGDGGPRLGAPDMALAHAPHEAGGPADSAPAEALNTGAEAGAAAFPDPSALLAASKAYERSNATRPLLRFDFDDASWGANLPNLAVTAPRTGTRVGGARLTARATQGHFGRALVLDGIDDHLLLRNPTMLDGVGNQLTVQAWVYAESVDPQMMRVVSRWTVAEQGKRAFSLSVYQKRAYFVVSSDGTNRFSVQGTAAIKPHVWTHLAGTCDGSTLRVYVDKQLDAAVALPGGFAFPQSGGSLVVGRRDATSTEDRWTGMIDEVYVYGVARDIFGRRYRVTVPSIVQVGAPFDVHLAVLREDGQPHAYAEETLALSEPDGAVTLPRSTVAFNASQQGAQWLFGAVCTKPGIRRLSVDVAGHAITTESNPFYCAETLPQGRQIVWGDMHWHSNLGWNTDVNPHGLGSPDDGYLFAQRVAGLDFAAMSEHAFRLKHPVTDWQTQIDAANRYHQPGRFTTILGYEWRGDGAPSGTRWGHHIVRFPGFDPTRVTDPRQETAAEVRYVRGVNVPPLAMPGASYIAAMHESPVPWDLSRDDTRDLANLWPRVAPYWATVTPHHLGAQPLYAPSRYPAGATPPYLEIYSKWGASELRNNARTTYAQHDGGPLAQDALRNGFVVGFVGGSDSHLTTPGGRTSERAENLQYREPGLTACLVQAKTRKALWLALLSRHCYAASGERILALLSIDGALPGSQLAVGANHAPVIDVVAAGTTALKVELLRDNEVIYTDEPNAALAGFRHTDIGFRGKAYYYVRVTQVDGERAWVSPIWVTSS